MKLHAGRVRPGIREDMHVMAACDKLFDDALQIALRAAAGDVPLPNQPDVQRLLHESVFHGGRMQAQAPVFLKGI